MTYLLQNVQDCGDKFATFCTKRMNQYFILNFVDTMESNMPLTIEKLAKKYYEITGQSPEYSFWTWLDACGIQPIDSEIEYVYNHIEEYI